MARLCGTIIGWHAEKPINRAPPLGLPPSRGKASLWEMGDSLWVIGWRKKQCSAPTFARSQFLISNQPMSLHRLRRSRPAVMRRPTRALVGSGTAVQVREEPLMVKEPWVTGFAVLLTLAKLPVLKPCRRSRRSPRFSCCMACSRKVRRRNGANITLKMAPESSGIASV